MTCILPRHLDSDVDRMPEPLGGFISEAMYDTKLRSDHKNKDDFNCVRFVNVSKGEEQQQDKSYKVRNFVYSDISVDQWKQNMEEVQTVVRLVQNYYHRKKYCIITPYDAQRAAISRELARNGLPDSVFNVDSFQGELLDFALSLHGNPDLRGQEMRRTM